MPELIIKPDTSSADPAKVPDGATATVAPDHKPGDNIKGTVPMVPPAESKPEDKKEEKLFAGKYKTIEEFEKGHKELEAKLGAPKPKEITPEAAKTAGLDVPALTREFTEKGDFTKETRDKLKAAGFEDAGIDNWIAGTRALQKETFTDLATSVGGTEQLSNVIKWAETGLTEAEKRVYNEAVASGNTDGAKLLMRGINEKYLAARGKDPKLVKGEGVPAGTPEGFESAAQMVEAMRDPRYAKDPAYRAKVEQKVKFARF